MEKDLENSKGLIMVVDDEVDTREILGSMLAAINYDHLPVKSGKEAIEKYKELKEEIDLVMLDIFMPRMPGAEIYKNLFEIDPDIVVLVVSGYGKETSEVQGLLSILKDKNADYITKPFDLRTMDYEIEKLLKGKKKVAA